MTGIQRIIILGHVGKDPELKETRAGNPMCSFSVAVNERQAEGRPDRTEWFRIVVYGGRLALQCAERLKKGSAVYIEGVQRSREWLNADGQTQRSVEIQPRDIQFIDDKKVIAA